MLHLTVVDAYGNHKLMIEFGSFFGDALGKGTQSAKM
jgi:hypothetical protein